MAKQQKKLFLPKWRLWLKKLKFWLFQSRPIPLFVRKRCPACKIVWNPELFKGCPLCGRGEKRVWILLVDGHNKKVYDDPAKARYDKDIIDSQTDSGKTEIEWWDIE